MSTKPKKWLAAALSFFAPLIGMLYAAQLRWVAVYFFAEFTIGVIWWFYPDPFDALPIIYRLICATHAYHLAQKYPDGMRRPMYSRWFVLLGVAAGLLSIIYGFRAFVAEPFRQPSGSMQPTIPMGARLLVQKWGYGNYGTFGIHLFRAPISAPLGRGDIIVFESPPNRSLHFVKRLIGLPGDEITYREKKLSVNGTPALLREASGYFDKKAGTYTPVFLESLMGTEYSILMENYHPVSMDKSIEFPFRDKCTYDTEGFTCAVPDGHYFVMGDNRNNSYDSRLFGFVPADHIVGKIIYITP